MLENVELRVNGKAIRVPAGVTVATAVFLTGLTGFRRSVSGELRGPLCGMGICFECRVSIDGAPHCRACQILCRDGMEVETAT